MSDTKKEDEGDESPQDKKELLDRLSRIRGQVEGIRGMVEDDEYCIDLINQIHSTQRALDGLAVTIMEDHLKGCVRDAIRTDGVEEERDKIEEFLETVEHFLKK